MEERREREKGFRPLGAKDKLALFGSRVHPFQSLECNGE